MKDLRRKLLIFLLPPLVAAWVLELAILPIDFFTFRVWETLRVDQHYFLLKGPFYPDRHIRKTEVGGLAAHTQFAVEKNVEWITDSEGYRKQNTTTPAEIVIVGDSMVAGATLTQSDILAEVLERELGECVYPMAPANLKDFMHDRRFLDRPPRILILECTQRNIPGLRKLRSSTTRKIQQWIPNLAVLQSVAVSIDRVLAKRPMQQYAQARIRRALYPGSSYTKGGEATNGLPMFFLEGEKALARKAEVYIPTIVERLVGYRDALAARGIQLIFLPVPDKETIYPELVPGDWPPQSFLPQLCVALEAAGIKAVNLQAAYEAERARAPGQLLYHTDDTHWNPVGVRVCARELAARIREG